MAIYDLTGRVAIVTGGARGFGRAICERLAGDGAHIVVADMRKDLAEATAAALRDTGAKAVALVADISDEAAVNALVADTIDTFGTIDILVNNAGYMKGDSPAETIPLSEWDTTFAVNLRGPFLLMKAVLPVLREKGSGRVINISSSAGRQTSTFGGAHYTASKAGLLGLTRHAAREYAQFGITVNAVAPGTFLTEGAKEEMEKVGLDASAVEAARQACPSKRLGKPGEVADAVAFLASDQAAYITGATIDVNGGDLMM
ncbi:SDR family NAD(P)-dependent oxidoreductase [Shimia biformata]|uniref:SDR family NAD(P)-dependent oxidoreductase n=1 Tax=Shimia biformata TaxID=1294299 RepID=UPI00194FF498|nr:SDR family NAD(P)-dependent oxidoreductase [Shimia biformata]